VFNNRIGITGKEVQEKATVEIQTHVLSERWNGVYFYPFCRNNFEWFSTRIAITKQCDIMSLCEAAQKIPSPGPFARIRRKRNPLIEYQHF
jgi:hypothetical protein